MVGVKSFRSAEVKSSPLPGVKEKEAGWIKRVVYPPQVSTKGPFLGCAQVQPGYSVHRWHRHTRDEGEGFVVVYPRGFEEIYYIVSGSGVIQWKTDEGKIEEEKVGAGDAIFLPADVTEHQLLNSGKEKMFVVYAGSPPPQVTFTK